MKRSLVATVTLALAVSFSPAIAETTSQQLRRLQEDAMTAYKAGKFADAAADFTTALALRPHSPRLLYNLASCEAKAGRPQDAIRALQAYADLGLVADIAHDDDFDTLNGDPALEPVLAKFSANLRPVGTARLAATLSGAPLLAEGIAFDSATKRFFVSSVDRRKIIAVAANGDSSDFVPSATGGLLGAFGIAVDAKRQRLWVSVSGIAHAQSLAESDRGASGVFSFALADGHLTSRAVLPKSGEERVINDIAVAADGTVFASDSVAPVLYTVDDSGAVLAPWLRDEAFVSLQGIATTPDGTHLIVADYARGLHFIDIKSKTVETQYFADGTILLGIDALVRDKNTLLAVQNGTNPQRILALSLDDAGTNVTRVRILSANDKAIPEPSLGTIAGQEFCVVANAQWSRFKDDGTATAALDPVRIECVGLPTGGK